ncbi:MAG: hypothetical protein ACK56W_20040 [Pirellula sp.]|jgi:hypothetical protein|nr:hypothetical protein [Pirellula sp.]
MTLRKKGKQWYGDDHADLRQELVRYSQCGEYSIDNLIDVKCRCGHQQFKLRTDETEGVAIRECVECKTERFMGDSAEFAEDAEVQLHECMCRKRIFELSVGVHRYRDVDDSISDDVRWIYIGCRCVSCGLVGCYADWKNEFQGYRKLLRKM